MRRGKTQKRYFMADIMTTAGACEKITASAVASACVCVASTAAVCTIQYIAHSAPHPEPHIPPNDPLEWKRANQLYCPHPARSLTDNATGMGGLAAGSSAASSLLS